MTFKAFDIGDVVGVTGTVFRTQKGEISLHVTLSITLLAKSLKVLPEKYHGLKDPDLRYRQRYVDMIVNPEVRDTFRKRTLIIKAVREFSGCARFSGGRYTGAANAWKSALRHARSKRTSMHWILICFPAH